MPQPRRSFFPTNFFVGGEGEIFLKSPTELRYLPTWDYLLCIVSFPYHPGLKESENGVGLFTSSVC